MKLRDAKKPITVVPMPEHVDKAIANKNKHCVAANTIEACPGIDWAHVGYRYTRVIFESGDMRRLMTPKWLVPHLKKFDKDKVWEFPPGTEITFEVPRKSDKLGHKRKHFSTNPERWKNPRTGKRYKNTGRLKPRNLGTRTAMTRADNLEIKKMYGL